MSVPVFRDPVYDGATDPSVVWKESTDEWWMFYTQRRTTDSGPGQRWVHGTEIGVAVSTDGGRSWTYRGVVVGLERGSTLWAPEVIRESTGYRMYLTVVDGVPDTWHGAEAHIVEYRSDDLERWDRVGRVDLGSDRVIDAAAARCPDGLWRLWYKNERDASSTWAAVSSDLESWSVEGRAIPATPPHEGPNVFALGGWYWMITDEWRGLGVHRSVDAVHWERQSHEGGLILSRPGADPADRALGHHADAVVWPDVEPSRGVLFYFTHPATADGAAAPALDQRLSAIHAAELTIRDGILFADRDVPVGIPFPDLPESRA
jgi:hypothetical protein